MKCCKKEVAQEDGGIMMTGEFEGQTGEHPLGAVLSGLILPWTSGIDSKCWLCSFGVLHFLILKLTHLERLLNLPRERMSKQ